ncbi:MAG: ABC transporter ATP-binding protein, partial [Burkholderiales bacterium]|nr:ABC transporter ATP-binding protein [Burkholderiales bacterium]
IDRKSEPFRAVKGISFDIPTNSTVALVGESGSGKSVSAMAMLGLLPDNAIISPQSQVIYGGRDLLKAELGEMQRLRGKDISVIFQEPMTSLNPVFTVGEQIAESLRLHMGMSGRQAAARVVELLNEVGIPNPQLRVKSYPHEMSGGQQQRVMIAMAIACEPKLLIADEPTTALDVTIQKQILDLIASLQAKHNMSVLFITHDLGVVGEIADHVVVMQNGVIQEQGTIREIFESPQHPYTKALLACRPRLDRRPKRLPVIDDFMKGDGRPHLEERSRGISPSDPIILEVKGLNKTFFLKEGLFGKRAIPAVKDVSFKLPRGKTLGLVGESGSGKTTVGLTLMRLHDATSGEVLFEGTDLLRLTEREMMAYRRRIQIIFQNPYASLNPRFTVGQILVEPMKIHGIGRDERERVDMAFQLLKRVGLSEQTFYKYPHEFSGGQRQRIAIARCLTMKPDVLICDESVSALDVSVQAQVLNLLQDLQDEYHMSYIFISHDLAVVKYISDEVMVMN